MDERQQTEVQLVVHLAIIRQLLNTREGKLFANRELNPSQFGVLNHFTHNPDRSWTVTELVSVMEMNQPGITKIVTVLLKKDLLISTQDKTDKRKHYLKITKQGLDLCGETFQSLLPDISHLFGDWGEKDLTQLQVHLEKLMRWLDEHRNDIKLG